MILKKNLRFSKYLSKLRCVTTITKVLVYGTYYRVYISLYFFFRAIDLIAKGTDKCPESNVMSTVYVVMMKAMRASLGILPPPDISQRNIIVQNKTSTSRWFDPFCRLLLLGAAHAWSDSITINFTCEYRIFSSALSVSFVLWSQRHWIAHAATPF